MWFEESETFIILYLLSSLLGWQKCDDKAMVLKNIFHIAQHVFKTLINFSKHARRNTENSDTDCLCQIAISVPLKLSVSAPRVKKLPRQGESVFLGNLR